SEVDRAEKVCRHLDVELHKIKVDQEKFLRFWPLTVYHNDEPNFFTQNILSMIVSNAVHQDGFKVLLTGEGSDELFGGYDWQIDAYRMWRIRRFQVAILPNIRLFHVLGRLLSKLSPPDLSNLMRHPLQNIQTRWPGQKPTGQFCAVDGGQRSFRQAALFKKLAEVKPLEERAFLTSCFEDLYAHLRISLSSHEKMAMACSVEARVPFLENHLVDFGLHLPFSAKYHKGVAKRVVKAAAVKMLPFDIVHAKKIGFGINDEFWGNTASFLKDGFVSEFFKWGKGERDAIYKHVSSDRLLLFNLMSMELWARIYCNGESPESLGEQLLEVSHEPIAD
ncbi:MAG: asparagine synthase, partial [Candidatus Omnitrophica bacterium]|nr:asparagine synthase [Candidatus Omnitrophota bacterium]